MIEYTTPAIPLVVEGVDLTQGQNVYVSFVQGDIVLEKRESDLTMSAVTHDQITDTNITVILSQEESAKFCWKSAVAVQVNWIDSSGVRDATEKKTISVMSNLLDRVVEYDPS